LAAVVETRAQAAAEYRRARLGELTIAEGKAAGLAQDVVKASKRSHLQLLQAPEDGIVQQLAVYTLGGVVTAAQPLLELVPLDNHLEIEATLPNRDVGFVRAAKRRNQG
jgi:hemolysin D